MEFTPTVPTVDQLSAEVGNLRQAVERLQAERKGGRRRLDIVALVRGLGHGRLRLTTMSILAALLIAAMAANLARDTSAARATGFAASADSSAPPPVLCPGCNLYGADFADANLSEAYFGSDRAGDVTVLTGAYLEGADLAGATLSGAAMSVANLTGANLTNAGLYKTDLSNATLTNANLTGAVLSYANLTNAILTGATGGGTALAVGVIWANTTCPDGTNSNHDSHTCIGHGG